MLCSRWKQSCIYEPDYEIRQRSGWGGGGTQAAIEKYLMELDVIVQNVTFPNAKST